MFQSILNTLGVTGMPSGFNYKLNDPVLGHWRDFEIYSGEDLKSNKPVSIFKFSKKQRSLEQAKHFIAKLRTLRHPGILRYLDSAESSDHLYLATEPAFPFVTGTKDDFSKDFSLYALYCLFEALNFLQSDCNLSHNTLSMDCLFFTKPYFLPKLSGFTETTASKITSSDDRGIQEISRSLLSSVPDEWLLALKRGEGVSGILRTSIFFNNPTVKCLLLLRTIHLEKKSTEMLSKIPLSLIPGDIKKGPLLELLTNLIDINLELAAIATQHVMAIAKEIPWDTMEFKTVMFPVISKLVAISDRNVRFSLLKSLNSLNIINLIDKKDFEKILFLDLLSGFSDSHPAIREETVNAAASFYVKLKPATIGSKLLPHLIKIQQTDTEGVVRTAAITCLATIFKNTEFTLDNRNSILIEIAINGLKDSYSSARIKTISMLSECAHFLTDTEIAMGILPALCPHIMDLEIAYDTLELVKKLCGRFQIAKPEISRDSSLEKGSEPAKRTEDLEAFMKIGNTVSYQRRDSGIKAGPVQAAAVAPAATAAAPFPKKASSSTEAAAAAFTLDFKPVISKPSSFPPPTAAIDDDFWAELEKPNQPKKANLLGSE
jgi:SCY1-like protein 1